jgi:hypothetical protein
MPKFGKNPFTKGRRAHNEINTFGPFSIVFSSSTGRTTQPIFTHHGSKGAVWPKQVRFGLSLITKFGKGDFFFPQNSSAKKTHNFLMMRDKRKFSAVNHTKSR